MAELEAEPGKRFEATPVVFGGSSAPEPTITRVAVVPGHDGSAELFVEISYPSGGRKGLTLDLEAAAEVVSVTGVSTVDELVGLGWSACVATPRSPNFD